MAKLKFKNPKTGLWEEVSGSLQNLKDGEKASLYMDNTNEVTTPAGGTTLHPNPTPSTTSPTATGTGSFAVGSGTKATGDVSVAEGVLNEASGKASHAEGAGTKAGGNASHAEGFYTEAAGDYSYAGNYGTAAQGKKSHAEGGQTKAIGDCTHAEGDSTTAQGRGAHAEGAYTFANGEYSHAEGCGNNFEGADQKLIAEGTGAHAEGFITNAMGDYSHAEGENTIAGVKVGDTFDDIAVTDENKADYRAAHAEGIATKAYKKGSHAEGIKTVASGESSHAEGDGTKASGVAGHAEGVLTSGKHMSHAEGERTTAGAIIGDVIDGNTVTASNIGNYRAAHAEGLRTVATGAGSHAEGGDTIASGLYSHAEGKKSTTGEIQTTASGEASHAEGVGTKASGYNSHSEGGLTTASGMHSHAEGYGTTASGKASHAGGTSTIAQWDNSTVVGKYNKTSNLSNTSSDPLFIVGNGTNTSTRKNALEVFTDGTAYVNGKKILVEGDAGGGSGDVTAAGDNYFTGANSFSEIVNLDGGITVGTTGIECNGPISLKAIQATARYIDGLVTPTSDDHAANKKYVDDKVITSATANATTLSYYEPATASVKLNNGVLDFTFGIPQGEPAENPCLIEGTQITMADNTTKSVEDLKPGDVILSYDPVKKQKTKAVVIDAYKTGEAKVFDVYSFENGKYLTVYGIHGFYANELGYVKNIQDITKTNELIDENLNTTYLIVKRKMPLRDKPKSRYMIISSNNLYFANGILLGHSPWNKGQYCIKYGIEVPEAIKEIYQSEINAYNGYDSFINTPEYHAEISEQYAKLANAVNEIKIYKDKLTATDYKVQKYTEGVLPEAEWQEAKAKRAAWRQAVNDNEQLRDESRKMVNNIIKKYRNGVTMKQLFEESCVKDNESFETIKNYFDN